MKHMKGNRLLAVLALLVLGASLSGCNSVPLLEGKKIDYKSAGTLPPLEVPPDLTAPSVDDQFRVSDVATNGTATLSSYSRERQEQPQTTASGVLPVEKDVKLERAGSERWLVVKATPEQVWPVVKEFWQSLGFIIATERPEAGVMETDWAENRAKIPQDPIRSVLGKVFDSLYSTAERDKFRTRLERGSQPGTTEIYISHRGMYEVIKGGDGGDQTVWEPMPPDPGLEAEMLRRLMSRFGVDDAQAKSMLAAKGEEKRAELVRAGGETVALQLHDPFDRAWRRVGLALDRIGFTVEDRDRSKGLYYVRYVDPEADKQGDKGFLSKLAFWRSSAADKGQRIEYRILVAEAGAGSKVEVQDKEGKLEHSKTGNRILNLLYEQLK